MKTKLLLLSAILTTLCLNAQDRFSLGLVYSPGFSDIKETKQQLDYESQLFHSFGIRACWNPASRIYLNTGLYLHNQGAGLPPVMEATPEMPEGTGRYFDFKFLVRTIAIPLTVGYDLARSPKIRLMPDIGISNGFLLKSRLELLNDYPEFPKYSDVETIKDYFLNLEAGLGLDFRAGQKLLIGVRPNIRYQINTFDKTPVVNMRLFSYSFDLGVSLIL